MGKAADHKQQIFQVFSIISTKPSLVPKPFSFWLSPVVFYLHQDFHVTAELAS